MSEETSNPIGDAVDLFAKFAWAIAGALSGAVLAFVAAMFWVYLERSDFGAREPVYAGYWWIAAYGAMRVVSLPGAVVGGVMGYLVWRRRRGRRGR